jgi:hypothetical protein
MTMTTTPPVPESMIADLERLARTELSTGARLGYVVLALVASAMTIVVSALWLTEPALPLRTRIAFAMLTGIGLGWLAFSIWVLRAKRTILARQRVVAGRLAVTFSGLFTAGCLVFATMTNTQTAWIASAMSLIWLMAALVLWRRAQTALTQLLVRRDLLERQLDGRAR